MPDERSNASAAKSDRTKIKKREWLRAAQGGSAPLSNFDYASVLTEAMLLANVAIRLGNPIAYDGQKGEITNHQDTARLIAPSPREGWER